MKKLFSILLALILTLVIFTACGKNNVNDRDSGKIKDFKVKHEYVDGNYYIFAEKFDNDSKAPYMKLTVKNKILTSIYFNYLSTNGTLYLSDNNNNETWFYIKTLNTDIFARAVEYAYFFDIGSKLFCKAEYLVNRNYV